MDLLRPLKLQLFARLLHLALQLLDRLFHIAAQEFLDVAAHLRIFLLAHFPYARTQALPDMIIQTFLFRQMAAFAQRIHAVDELHRIIRRSRIRIRAEIRGFLILRVAHDLQPGRLFPRQLQIGIRLVIHEHDVEGRRMLLDQVDLKQQRFLLAPGHDVFEIIDVGDQTGRLQIMCADKILSHPVLEHLRLADIDDVSSDILHQITARQRRQDGQLVGDLFHVSHASSPSASARPPSRPDRLRPALPCGSFPRSHSASGRRAPPCAARLSPCRG